jgi:hypothetical protein
MLSSLFRESWCNCSRFYIRYDIQMLRMIRRRVLDALPGPLSGRLRRWSVGRLVRNFTPRVVTHTYGDGSLEVYLSDPPARG